MGSILEEDEERMTKEVIDQEKKENVIQWPTQAEVMMVIAEHKVCTYMSCMYSKLC